MPSSVSIFYMPEQYFYNENYKIVASLLLSLIGFWGNDGDTLIDKKSIHCD